MQVAGIIITLCALCSVAIFVYVVHLRVVQQREQRQRFEKYAKEILEFDETTERLAFQNAVSQRQSLAAEARTILGTPPQASFSLHGGEVVRFVGSARRSYRGEPYSIELGGSNQSISRTSGGARGAIVGGLLLGPVGAVAGYAASRKTTITDTPKAPSFLEKTPIIDDSGQLIVTTHRVVFIGQRDIVEIPLTSIASFRAYESLGYRPIDTLNSKPRPRRPHVVNYLFIKYGGMQIDESFTLANYFVFEARLRPYFGVQIDPPVQLAASESAIVT